VAGAFFSFAFGATVALGDAADAGDAEVVAVLVAGF